MVLISQNIDCQLAIRAVLTHGNTYLLSNKINTHQHYTAALYNELSELGLKPKR